LRGWWGNPWGFESPLRHHRNTQREFGFAPSSLFSFFQPEWLICGSWVTLPQENYRTGEVSGKYPTDGVDLKSSGNLNGRMLVKVGRICLWGQKRDPG
jgi:hypothetical protein